MKSLGVKTILGLAAWLGLSGAVLLLPTQSLNNETGLTPWLAAENPERHPKRSPPPAEDQWPEVEQFLKVHSQRKLAAYEEMPDRPFKAMLRSKLIAQYNELARMPDKRAKQLEIQRVEIEDEIFGALAEAKRNHLPPGDLSPEYLAAVRKLIENRMEERQARLDALQATVTRLKDEVARDDNLKKNPSEFEARVKERARNIMAKGLAIGQGTGSHRHPTTQGIEDAQ